MEYLKIFIFTISDFSLINSPHPFLMEIILFSIFSFFCIYLCYIQTKIILIKSQFKITNLSTTLILESYFTKYFTLIYLISLISFLGFLNIYFKNYLYIFNDSFIINNFTIYFKIIFFFINLFFIINISETFINYSSSILFYLLLSIFFLIGSLLISSINLFYIFCLIEFITMLFYSFMCTLKTKSSIIHSTLSYLIYNATITFFMVLVIFYFSFLINTLTFIQFYYFILYPLSLIINTYTLEYKLLFFSFNYLFIFLFYKLAIVPFIFWIKDVYTGLPIFLTGFININTKLIFFFLFIKLLIIFKYFNFFYFSLLVFGIITVIIGSFITYYQNSFKTFLIYSSISHLGYLILCLSQLNCQTKYNFYFINQNLLSVNNIYLIKSIIEYFLFYLLILTFLWILLSHITEYLNYTDIEFSKLMRYLTYNPIESFFIFFCLISLGGLPPTYMFFLKFNLLQSILQLNSSLFILIIIGYISLISAFYYLKLIKILYLDNKISYYKFNNIYNVKTLQNTNLFNYFFNYNFFLTFLIVFILTINTQILENLALILTYYIL